MNAFGFGNIAKPVVENLDIENSVLLGTAMIIDMADLIPLDIIGLGLIYELPLSVVETLLLMHLGVPKRSSVLAGVLDLVPFIDIIPWTTLAVLDKRFGVRLPVITRIFNA